LAYKPQFGVLLKAGALASASLLATPYIMDNDLVVLAIAFFARHGLKRGFRDYEIGMLAAAWVVPLLSRSVAGIAAIPLGLMVMLASICSCCGERRSIVKFLRRANTE
jgi:alpha-1,2-mannosyltransferase